MTHRFQRYDDDRWSSARRADRPSRAMDLRDEDDGLASFVAPASASPSGVSPLDASVLSAVRDLFQTSLRDPSLRWVLDPFSHADLRYRTLMDVFHEARQSGKIPDGPLRLINPTLDILRAWYAETIGWGPAQDFLDDPKVNEVKINGVAILVQEAGRPFVTAPVQFSKPEEVTSRAMLVASILGVRLDASNPQETLPVSNGTRMHVSIPPRVDDDIGALVCIRRGRTFPWTLRTLLERHAFTEDVYRVLMMLVQAGCSFLVTGRTGAGKTTLMEALVNEAPHGAHVLTIEDLTREISVATDKVWTPEFVDTVADPSVFSRATREALRQTPDIICPGEVRGTEAGAILQLLQTGHAVITTIHGGTAEKAIRRFATLASMQGAHLYEGRYDDALEETALGFHAVAVMEHSWMYTQRAQRVLSFLGFPEYDASQRAVRIVPAVQAEFGNEGVTWHVHVPLETQAFAQDLRIPMHVREAIIRSNRVHRARSTSLTSHVVQETIQTARSLALSGQSRQATEVLQATWVNTLDMELLAAAQQLLPHLDVPPETERMGASLRHELADAIRMCEWTQADAILRRRIFAHVTLAALCLPEEGWGATLSAIDEGLRRERSLRDELSRIESLKHIDDLVVAAHRIRGLANDVLTVGSDIRRAYQETRQRVVMALASGNMVHSDVAEAIRRLTQDDTLDPAPTEDERP